jgi:predicted cupin superfamily sugar epimerase
VVPPGAEAGVVRPTATAIHYLLCAGEQSRFHRVRSAELWLHHRGAPLEVRLGGSADTPGDVTTHVLGSDVEAGQQPQVLVPAGTWQAAGPAGADVLVSCVVSPGFDFADWTLAGS